MRQTDKLKNRHAELAEIETQETGFVFEPVNVEVGSGYAIAVTYENKNEPIVNIIAYGQADLAKVRRDILKVFPNARIRQLCQRRRVSIAKKNKRDGRTRKK